MSGTCYRCFKSKEACLCSEIISFDPGVKFVLLIHPHEARFMRTGTGRLAHLSMQHSELIQGIDFTQNVRLNALLSDPAYYPMLLYPGKEATTTDNPLLKEQLGDKKLLIILLDGTWHEAKKMLQYSTNLHTLPRLSFNKGYRTRFVFKKEPTEEAISTIESCYYLIQELSELNLANKEGSDHLMVLFDKMVAFQLACEKVRRNANLPERQGIFHKD